VFHQDECNEIKETFRPLIDHRRRVIGEDRTKILDFSPSETRSLWLRRQEVTEAIFNPSKDPYYLLLVGSPPRIAPSSRLFRLLGQLLGIWENRFRSNSG
jgi:hypothetical protein